MGTAEEMACLAREVIASYEARVSSVEQIIEATHEMLEASGASGRRCGPSSGTPWPGQPP